MRIIDVLSNQATTPGTPFVNVHNLIILDESGSMHLIKQQAIDGVNFTLKTIRDAQKANPEQKHTITLVTFNSLQHNLIQAKAPIDNVPGLNWKTYNPAGATPLYDAMGRSINGLRKRTNENDVVLVTIVTDGMENASCEYTAQAIRKLVEEMKEKGWVFTYIGANQDVEAVAFDLAIDNHLSWQSTAEGSKEMFQKENSSRMAFFNKLHNCQSVIDIQKDFFNN